MSAVRDDARGASTHAAPREAAPPPGLRCAVWRGGRARPDHAPFASAQWLRAVAPLGPAPGLDAATARGVARALDALEACRSADGGFRFWPPAAWPRWAPRLPDDLDDTAVMATLLHRHGRLGRDALRGLALRRLVAFRQPSPFIAAAGAAPPWARAGSFRAWARDTRTPCVFDVVVNLNVLAALACADLPRAPGRREALGMVEDALEWAGECPRRAAAIAPFYPAAGELVLALAHAVDQGEHALAPALAHVRGSPMWRASALDAARGAPVIAGSPHGLWTWTCAAVGAARRRHASVARALGEAGVDGGTAGAAAGAGIGDARGDAPLSRPSASAAGCPACG